ncbi:small GTP-binding protein, putative [Trichomonas vaginalis G3]|uniref:Small GTP-binding protein, putative n=1 Tax=Trichomonas vaginalis (strain ATCC PRA-98 / G3) TaxID=412133 RepID=A2G974_TRIV3|nr:regulation of endocytosis [Trichomonas vaginalis G3]EAX86289.1 small GTP-binding protein, putative [Trichomonas vaginalis G3]KAI5541572.1 regulation of endocytosis [Trichomonas vaginalis G3]|eukprot:XP_001299219.1 small GTP-binding protein [Trichomonas vaginalis G3]
MLGRKFDYSLKVVVVGDSGVGKTCLLIRFIRDLWDEDSQPTLGVEFMTKIVSTEKHRIQLQLWDTAGQELFRSVTRGYYRGSAGALLVFDLTNSDSFANINRWLQDVKDVARADVVTLLIGNKVDICEANPEKRQVTRQEAEDFAKQHNMKYFETSAKTGVQINEAINACVDVIEANVASGTYDVTPNSDNVDFEQEEKPHSTCC